MHPKFQYLYQSNIRQSYKNNIQNPINFQQNECQSTSSQKSKLKQDTKKRYRKHNQQIERKDKSLLKNEGDKQKGRRTKNYYGTWKYFNKVVIQNVTYGQCHICLKQIYVTSGTTVQLIRHLENQHKNIIIYNPQSQEDYQSLLARQISLTLNSYESISKMNFLRHVPCLRKFTHEFNRSKISLLIKKEYLTKKFHQKEDLYKSSIPPFSIYLDEYNLNFRKFFNVFVLDSNGKPFHINLFRFFSSDTSNDLYQRIAKDLSNLEISNEKIERIVCANNDLMIKIAQLGGWKLQPCLLKMMQGLISTFFHKCNANNIFEEKSGLINDEEFESDEENESLPIQNSIEYRFDGYESQIKVENIQSEIEVALTKLKKIIKILKNSLHFRKRIDADRQKNMHLFIGCQRWKDFGQIIRQYDKNRVQINEVLDKSRMLSLKLTESEDKAIMQILPTLELLYYSMLTLTQPEYSTMIGAQRLISKICVLLMKPEYLHGKYLSQILTTQYSRYRNTKLICINYYLYNKIAYENKLKNPTKWTTLQIEQIQESLLSEYDQKQESLSNKSTIKPNNLFDKLYSNKFQSRVLCLAAELKEYRNSGIKGVRLNQIVQRMKGIYNHSNIDIWGFDTLRTIELSNKWKISSESIKYLSFLHYYHKNTLQECKMEQKEQQIKREESESSGWSCDFLD